MLRIVTTRTENLKSWTIGELISENKEKRRIGEMGRNGPDVHGLCFCGRATFGWRGPDHPNFANTTHV